MRRKPNGKCAPWLFRFDGSETDTLAPDVVSTTGNTSLYRESKNKTIVAGKIDIDEVTNVYKTPWAEMIKGAKAALPCWNVDTQAIWERFLAFNRARGNAAVPAGFLLGFMRRWRAGSAGKSCVQLDSESAISVPTQNPELVGLIPLASTANRHFHESDLCRAIGAPPYEKRVPDMMAQFGCLRFPAVLAVHGAAIQSGEITR